MDDSYTIQISSNLINRLVGDEKKEKKRVKKPKSKASQQTHESLSKATSNLDKSQNNDDRLKPPLFLPVPPAPSVLNPELEAIQSVLQESERTVERLQREEGDMVQELSKRAKELHEKEFKLPYRKPMPCVDELSACKKCYEEHLQNPLTCSHLVQKYVNCTREARMQARSTKE